MGICLIVKSGGGTDTSNANVTADKILSGYTVYSNDNKITGTMRNVGNQNNTDTTWGNTGGKYSCWPDGTIWIWEGWHDGTSGVNAVTLASQTSGCNMNGAGDVLWGYTYWSGGERFSGMMPAVGKKEWSIGVNDEQKIEVGWHDGTGTVSQPLNVDNGEWGIGGSTSQQQLCWSGWYYSKNRWCWGDGNLVAWNIKNGVSIYGVTGNYVETKRYLIQNGSLTGLLSSSFIGQGKDSTSVTSKLTKSYNNTTWRLVSCDGGYDGDGGSYWGLRAFLRFQNIGSLASFSAGSWKCRIHGEFYTDAYAGGYGGNMAINTYWAETDNIVWRGNDTTNTRIDIAKNAYGGTATISFAFTKLSRGYLSKSGAVLDIGKWIKGQMVANDFFMYFGLAAGDDSAASWRWLWCKNLWLETTETTP